MRKSLIILSVLVPIVVRAEAETIPALLDVPTAIANIHPELVGQRSRLVQQRDSLRIQADNHNANCRSVEVDTPQETACRSSLASLNQSVNNHIRQTNEFNSRVSAVAKVLGAPPKKYDDCTRWCRDQFLPDVDRVRSCIAANCRQTPETSPAPGEQRVPFVPLRPAAPR